GLAGSVQPRRARGLRRRLAHAPGVIPVCVTPGLDPGVHQNRWMAGSSPAMTFWEGDNSDGPLTLSPAIRPCARASRPADAARVGRHRAQSLSRAGARPRGDAQAERAGDAYPPRLPTRSAPARIGDPPGRLYDAS